MNAIVESMSTSADRKGPAAAEQFTPQSSQPSPLISLVIPCFNEEGCLETLFEELHKQAQYVLKARSELSFEIIIIDDGSKDQTIESAKKLLIQSQDWASGKIICFSRNFGKESALLAGLHYCSGDACITIDADLQDPPEVIPDMISSWLEGHEIVSAVRSDRSNDHWIKRFTAESFYRIFLALSKLDIQLNASDFRLLDRKVVTAILACEERVRFSKGFFAWAGFRKKEVYYKRQMRSAGEGKWNQWKLWNYALDGIFSFSTAPLRIWSYVGFIVTIAAFIVGMTSVVRAILFGIETPGYASLFAAVTLLGGLQLIGIGIVGEYLGRTYMESKRRPWFIVRDIFET
ncbi:glycosyltransferase family 2 protein [Synechococcus sp. CS-1329]|uniref:glycosyltransferase family 2 protein n=1 Tax=Synechococcus sp. CS-1329 TaxID=2847975 RepID=UPI00223B86AE|nr:glycosyltransferase family 2 protein [Synechococcus sp. CS-1329]MCT0219096.1 glycosyltransferase family 2 protein [Synechococcus sp. CS-1329]